MINEAEIGQYPVNFQNFLLRAKQFDSNLSWDNVLLFSIRVLKINDKLCYFDDQPVENLELYFERILKVLDYLLEVDWGRLYLFTQDIAHNLSSTELGQHAGIIGVIYSKIFAKLNTNDLMECVYLAMPSKDDSSDIQTNFMHIFEAYFIKPESHRQLLDVVEIAAVAHKEGRAYFVEQMIAKIQFAFADDQIEKKDETITDNDTLLILHKFLKARNAKLKTILGEKRKELEIEMKKLKRERALSSTDQKASKEPKTERKEATETYHYSLRIRPR